MWYAIQVKSGEEERLKVILDKIRTKDSYGECFVPLFEDVKRSGGKCRIGFRKLFPGYLFVESDDPQKIFETLMGIKGFTKLLGSVEKDGSKIFIPIGKEDEAFLRTLFTDGLMHVSYIHLARNGRIDRIVGPLSNYKNHIKKLEMRHRMAVVEAQMFGKMRKVKFGLWTDDDPSLLGLERLKEAEKNGDDHADVLDGMVELDLGIRPGDKVKDETGIYGEQIFVVEKVDTVRRTLTSTFEMFGTSARIELKVDEVRKA
jgi:transcription antitermination factor NusG